MKRYFIAAALIMALNIAIYPAMREIAYLERGHLNVFGGESMLFIFGFFVAAAVLLHGLQQKGAAPLEDEPPHTESEQSDNHIT